MTPDSEADLIQRAQAGDSSAEDELVRAFESMHRRLGRSDPDACQAARLGTLSAVRSYEPSLGVSLRTYAWVCAKHRVHCEAHRETPPYMDGIEEDMVSAGSPSPEHLATSAQLVARVRVLIERCDMHPTDREIVANRILSESGETQSELSARLGVSRQRITQREDRLRTEVLPRVLACLKDSI